MGETGNPQKSSGKKAGSGAVKAPNESKKASGVIEQQKHAETLIVPGKSEETAAKAQVLLNNNTKAQSAGAAQDAPNKSADAAAKAPDISNKNTQAPAKGADAPGSGTIATVNNHNPQDNSPGAAQNAHNPPNSVPSTIPNANNPPNSAPSTSPGAHNPPNNNAQARNNSNNGSNNTGPQNRNSGGARNFQQQRGRGGRCNRNCGSRKDAWIHAFDHDDTNLEDKTAEELVRLGYAIIERRYPSHFSAKPGAASVNAGLDIWATKEGQVPGPHKYEFLIECKQADPEYRAWVFSYDRHSYTDGMDNCGASIFLPAAAWSAHRQRNYATYTLTLYDGLNKVDPIKVCIFAKELKHEWEKEGHWETTSARISDASLHLAVSTNDILASRVERGPRRDTQETRLVPIIITTAKLYTRNYPTDAIDAATGRVRQDKKNSVDFREKKWVVYGHPLQNGLRYPTRHDVASYIDRNQQNVRQPPEMLDYRRFVFIVNSAYLGEFFRKCNV